MHSSDADYLKGLIRTVPDWPEPGVAFRDIMPLLRTPRALRLLVDLFVHRYIEADLDLVAGIDARGFIVGSIVAYELGLGFVPIRKAGKLPGQTVSETYQLEYGDASCVEMQADACRRGDRLLLFDDLIATGGTLLAANRLIERIGGVVVEAAAIIDLPELGGSRRIAKAGLPLHWLLSFATEPSPGPSPETQR